MIPFKAHIVLEIEDVFRYTSLNQISFLAFCVVFWFFWKTHFLLCFTQLSNQNKRCQQKSLIALILWLRFNSCFSSLKRLYQYMISFEAKQLSKNTKRCNLMNLYIWTHLRSLKWSAFWGESLSDSQPS